MNQNAQPPQTIFVVKHKSQSHTPNKILKVVKDWNFTTPNDPMQVLTMLTIAGVAVTGLWQGDVGEHFVAWCLPNSVALCGHLH